MIACLPRFLPLHEVKITEVTHLSGARPILGIENADNQVDVSLDPLQFHGAPLSSTLYQPTIPSFSPSIHFIFSCICLVPNDVI